VVSKEYSKNKEKNSIMISRLLQSHINYHEVVKNENYIDINQKLIIMREDFKIGDKIVLMNHYGMAAKKGSEAIVIRENLLDNNGSYYISVRWTSQLDDKGNTMEISQCNGLYSQNQFVLSNEKVSNQYSIY